ncbi:TspO/MBR-related protein, partial [Atractiella rhizophila]
NKIAQRYPTLRKPPYGDPPRAAFPVAWTSLYAAMGYGSYLLRHTIDTSLSKNDRTLAHQAFGLYWFSLALNLAWTPLFFGLQMPTLALLDITTLTGVVYVITVPFHIKASKLAGWLFLPYSLWLTYATYLNGGSWYLNILPRWQRKAEDKIHKGKDDL